jgi:hypothetical protein
MAGDTVFLAAMISCVFAPEIPPVYCPAYIAGISDAMSANNEGVAGWHVCFRSLNVTVQQLADVVKLWLQNHPEKRDLEAPGLVAEALEEAFPCNP